MNEKEYRPEDFRQSNEEEGLIAEYERYRYGGGVRTDYEDNDIGSAWSTEQLINEPDDIDGTLIHHRGESVELAFSSVPKMAWEYDDFTRGDPLEDELDYEEDEAIKNIETTNPQNLELEQLEQLGIDLANLSQEDEQLLAQLDIDWNEALDVTPERARQILRAGNIAGVASGFANDLLQYALNEADAAPWGRPLGEDSVLERVKIAPPRSFDSDSSLAQAIVKSDQFQEGMLDKFLPEVDDKASSITVGERETLNIQGQKFALNYRDGRGSLQTPRLSLGIGYAEMPNYTIEVEIWREADNSVHYEAEISGVAEDRYDFNNPSDEAVNNDAFARPTRLAFIAQKGGTLAQYKIFIELRETLEGSLPIHDTSDISI